MRRRYRKKHRVRIILQLIVLVILFLGLGYSYLSSSLGIQGSSLLNFSITHYKYAVNEVEQKVGDPLAEGINLRDTPNQAMQDWIPLTGSVEPIYNKFKVENGIVTEAYIEFTISNQMALENPGLTPGTYSLKCGVEQSEIIDEEIEKILTVFSYQNNPENIIFASNGEIMGILENFVITRSADQDIEVAAINNQNETLTTTRCLFNSSGFSSCTNNQSSNSSAGFVVLDPTKEELPTYRTTPSKAMEDWLSMTDKKEPFMIYMSYSIEEIILYPVLIITEEMAQANPDIMPGTYMIIPEEGLSEEEEINLIHSFLSNIFNCSKHPERCVVEDYGYTYRIQGLQVGIDLINNIMAMMGTEGTEVCIIPDVGCVPGIYIVNPTPVELNESLRDMHSIPLALNKEDAMLAWIPIAGEKYPFYIKHRIKPNLTIEESYIEIFITEEMALNNPHLVEGKIYRLRGGGNGAYNEENLEVLKTLANYPENPDTCAIINSNGIAAACSIQGKDNNNYISFLYENGDITFGTINNSCSITGAGVSKCT